MRKLFVMLCLISTSAIASDDITCEKDSKHGFVVSCKLKKEMNVELVSINGGECSSPVFRYHGSSKFDIPGSKECFYVRSVTLNIDGHNKTFGPL